jgi:hypothetical protein
LACEPRRWASVARARLPPARVAQNLKRRGASGSERAVRARQCDGRVISPPRAIEAYRTAASGGHVEQCDSCGHQRIAYNSYFNHHRPICQSLARAAWVAERTTELLDALAASVIEPL